MLLPSSFDAASMLDLIEQERHMRIGGSKTGGDSNSFFACGILEVTNFGAHTITWNGDWGEDGAPALESTGTAVIGFEYHGEGTSTKVHLKVIIRNL